MQYAPNKHELLYTSDLCMTLTCELQSLMYNCTYGASLVNIHSLLLKSHAQEAQTYNFTVSDPVTLTLDFSSFWWNSVKNSSWLPYCFQISITCYNPSSEWKDQPLWIETASEIWRLEIYAMHINGKHFNKCIQDKQRD